ncbi:MAG: 30S ribosomal protein S16 [Deltaproteobacteria bacterium]
MLRIRLARTGAKKKGSYRIVVIERERARDGRFVEILGHVNARRNPPELVLKRDRVTYWIGRGAQPSETVKSYLKVTPEAKS